MTLAGFGKRVYFSIRQQDYTKKLVQATVKVNTSLEIGNARFKALTEEERKELHEELKKVLHEILYGEDNFIFMEIQNEIDPENFGGVTKAELEKRLLRINTLVSKRLS
jgi:Fe-S cluster biosynthesis and repair protein YggX